MTTTADLAREAPQLPFTLGTQTHDDPVGESLAAVQYAVREGVTLYWGQIAYRGWFGFTAASALEALAGEPIPYQRIEADGTIYAVKVDGSEKLDERMMRGVAEDLAALR